MKIAYIAAGAAGMYCGSCLHDNTLAAALIRQGHDVALIPTYTPIRTDETDVSMDRVFYGAINVYLQHSLELFQYTPKFLHRLLDQPRLLNWIGKLGASTDARELGPLTLSVLQGGQGRQRKELASLVEWLVDFKPDIVQLTNSIFLGFAHQIKSRLNVPVLCGLVGEDLFLDQLSEPAKGKVIQELRRRARDVDGFVAPSNFYAELMADYLGVPIARMHVIPLGIGHQDTDPSPAGDFEDRPPTIGYLARICPEKGLHLLLEAFRLLTQSGAQPDLRLAVAGYLAERDRPYLEGLKAKTQQWGLADRVTFLGEVDRVEKQDFLNNIDILSVPTIYAEPKGLFALEAMAHGVPVVQPRHGSFPEMLEATGGGILVEPHSATALVEGLTTLLDDDEQRIRLGREGRGSVLDDFSDEKMAELTADLYESIVQRFDPIVEGTPA